MLSLPPPAIVTRIFLRIFVVMGIVVAGLWYASKCHAQESVPLPLLRPVIGQEYVELTSPGTPILEALQSKSAQAQTIRAYETLHPDRSVVDLTPFIGNNCARWTSGFVIRYAIKR